jgi:hypothetical protein
MAMQWSDATDRGVASAARKHMVWNGRHTGALSGSQLPLLVHASRQR